MALAPRASRDVRNCCNRSTRPNVRLAPAVNTFDQCRDLAFAMIANPKVAHALDVTREPTRIREKYGYTMFGQSALTARRLVETGVKFVTVFWDTWTDNNAAWDTHHNHHPRLKDGLCPKLDQILPDVSRRHGVSADCWTKLW